MYDTAVAFTKWCNEHGGINGREIVLSDVDAKLFEYEPAVTEACGRDFALVGGGAVFDEDPNNVRVGCDLPNIAGYVVSARGRVADLQVQPIPNTLQTSPSADTRPPSVTSPTASIATPSWRPPSTRCSS